MFWDTGGAASKSNFAGYAAITFMNILVAPAVNIFAIISGYVGFSEAENTTKRYARFLEIWCQVVFFCIVIQFAAILLKIDTFSITKIIKCFLPITFNAYWYVRAYFATVLIAPLINAAVASIGKQKLLSISFVLFLCFVFYGKCISSVNDVFTFEGGYSFAWVAYLFFVGASLRKTNFCMEKKKLVFAFVISTMFVLGWMLCFYARTNATDGYYARYWISYTSPMIFMNALCMVQLFTRISVPDCLKTISTQIGQIAFDIYLVHMNPIVYDKFWMGKPFAFLNEKTLVTQLLMFVVLGGAVFIISGAIGLLRLKLFQVFKMKLLCERLCVFASRKICRMEAQKDHQSEL